MKLKNKISRTFLWIQFAALVGMSTLNIGCKKFIDVEAPKNGIGAKDVFSSDAGAAAVMSAAYLNFRTSNLRTDPSFGGTYIITGLCSDELKLYFQDFNAMYYRNSVNTEQTYVSWWNEHYEFIYLINTVLEELAISNNISSGAKKQLEGEAKFVRAYQYFYMVNLYGDVPLVLSTDHKVNALIARTPKEKVYEQIIADLKDSENLLSAGFLNGTINGTTEDRVRPTKWAAKALLARVMLYTDNWVEAERKASEVIDHTGLFEMAGLQLDQVFAKNSKETIWAIEGINLSQFTETNTGEANVFVLPETGPNGFDYPVYLSEDLLNEFESGDLRRKSWVGTAAGYPYAYKYKAGKTAARGIENPIFLRVGEQYLIRAEARIKQGRVAEGIADINAIRLRATDISLPANDPERLSQIDTKLSESAAMDALMHERQIELFTEWGHRWFDLKRTGRIDQVMSQITPRKAQGRTWNPSQALFPIPRTEFEKNPALKGHQNPGYSE